jgi:hypothetical protein
MPARLSDLVRWLEAQGCKIEKPASGGSHWKARLPDGSAYPVPAHNALRSEIDDNYLGKIAKKLGKTLKQLLSEL